MAKVSPRIVDDDKEDILDLLEFNLTSVGYRVTTVADEPAKDAKEACICLV